MHPSNGDILVSARSKDGDIYATRMRFSDAAPLDKWSRVNARAAGTQARPVVVTNADGGSMLAWMDEVGPESSRKYPITAQVYDGGGAPLDIDFTASTQTPIWTDPLPENPDFYWDPWQGRPAVAFAFRAGASQSHYAMVWQRPTVNQGTPDNPDYEGGIVLQRLRGDAAECPDCGNAIPLRITGASKDKIDVVLTPGVVIANGQVDPFFTTPYTGPAEFGRKAVDLIVNGYLANNVFSQYLDEFNFYYDMTQGTRTMGVFRGDL
jgi:hypothetical protein